MAMDYPQSLFKRTSLFRRFSKQGRKAQNDAVYPPNSETFRPPRRDSTLQLRTPPQTPSSSSSSQHQRQHSNSSSPAATAAAAKPDLITHIHRIDLPRHPSSSNTPTHTSPTYRTPRVSPTALPTLPFPTTQSRTIHTKPWNVFLPPTHIFALYLGALPTDTCDKWFVYSEGPDAAGKLKVHFHQRWTGVKVAELFVVVDLRGEGAGKVVGIKWDGGEGMNCMGVGEARYLVRGCCRWALGIEVEEGC
ncbi:hypothetical protein P153DRAFT_361086 [Dothidotthia symphoricarpi CBS 119687]|uniref:Uncharacterized protein n=1 Tax=Dothidotthia symphoricarpi CBS 119687 TaxID=1392245 RepID=A0A6A5ZZP3_9PLEO|nr:uncharacterized protein P153DRAFT_361086 [Dothidotthia symphoricarpi CBS 119687]KAF2124363.1 hypothetical protein P153DRAFT_361086 [Dothidotthia symphoricarpi CBS 119687]